jgi:ribonuclease P protein component
MIARKHRFHSYGSLNSVYRQGQTARNPQLSLRYATRDPRKPYRVAVVVSRKVHKSAVVRNRIRRRIFEIVRQIDGQGQTKNAAASTAESTESTTRINNHASHAIQPGTDLIFTVFTDKLATTEAAELETIIIDLLEKAMSRAISR